IPPPPRSTLFPYTTLFRSLHEARGRARRHGPARAARLVRHCRAESHVEPARATVGIALEVRRGAKGGRATGAAAGAVAARARSTDRHGVRAAGRREVGDGVGT